MTIEERVAQIEKRQALASEYNSWLFNGDPKNLLDMGEKWAELSARHGFAPDGADKPQPASEGVRWFRTSTGTTVEIPSQIWWFQNGDRGGFRSSLTLDGCIARGFTELDGPPPNGRPLGKPATEGDELKERYFVWARQAPERKYESWADAVPFARAEIARATAPLVKERDELRAELARLKPTPTPKQKRRGKSKGRKVKSGK